MKTGAGQHIKYTEQIFLRTEFMCLVISLDRLLAVGRRIFFYQGTRSYGRKSKATDLPRFLEVDR
jgi:hypothetical protein